MNILSFSKNRFGQIWEKRILRWGNVSGIKLFLDFFYFGFTESTIKLHESNFPKCFLKFIYGVIGAKVTVRTFWHRADFLTALGTRVLEKQGHFSRTRVLSFWVLGIFKFQEPRTHAVRNGLIPKNGYSYGKVGPYGKTKYEIQIN